MGNWFKTTLLLGALTALIVWIGNMFGGQQGMVIAFVLAMGMNFFSYWFSDKIVLRMYRASEVSEQDSPELYDIVRNIAMKAGMPMPRIYVIPESSPNAFATGRNPEHAVVAVTQGLLELMNREEITGVLAHEMAHVRNRDILIGSIAATMAGADHDPGQHGALVRIYRRGFERRRTGRRRDHRHARRGHPRSACGHAHPDGGIQIPGVPGG